MKIFTLIFVSVLLGVGLGFATTVAEFGVEPPTPQLSAGEAYSADSPQVVVNQLIHDFGRMYQNQEDEFTYVFRNEGKGTLKLTPGKAPCKCTVSELSRDSVPPGESAELTLKWKTGFTRGSFVKGLIVNTNDPTKPQVRIGIRGTVIPEFRFDPPALILRSFSQNETLEREAKLYFFEKPAPQLLSYEFGNLETSDFYDLQYVPLGEDPLEDELAVAGYRINVTVKPGLPLGYAQQSVTFRTSTKTKSPVRLEMSGDVRTDITFFGPRMNRETNTLTLGTVPSGESRVARLAMQLTGNQRETVTYEVKETLPAELRVSFGEKRTLLSGDLVTVPVTIEVPDDAEPGSYLGGEESQTGFVLLKTSHSEYPEVRVNVKVAIAE